MTDHVTDIHSGIHAGSEHDPFANAPGRFGSTATVEVHPSEIGPIHTTYAPKHDGDPDPGEVVWTWVPFEEHDGRGKDRPVLIVAREHIGTVLAVQLTSKRHDGTTDFVDIGSGPWDYEGRESWVNLERVMRLHHGGMRREACAMERHHFDLVVARLRNRYNWS